jgi:hypothetical protein
MKKKLYKVSYSYTKPEDVVYFSANSFIEVINYFSTNTDVNETREYVRDREIINITCLGEIEILMKG